MFTGNMGKAQALESVLKSAELVQNNYPEISTDRINLLINSRIIPDESLLKAILELDMNEAIYENETLINILLSLEFIFFRVYGWFLIKSYIANPSEQGWFIIYISKWIRLEFILFIFSLLFIYCNIAEYKIFFIIMYIPSLVMALISTYILRDVFNHKSIN